MKKNKTIHKKLQGQWQVSCTAPGEINVRKILDIDEYSYWYKVSDDEQYMSMINSAWYGSGKQQITHAELMSVQWPSYMNPGEETTITVLPSGNFYE